VERLDGGLEALMADLEGANAVMGEAVVGGEEMRREAVEMETEMETEKGGRERASRL